MPESMQCPPANCTAPSLLWHAGQTPRATAVIEDTVRLDYRTLADNLARCAQALRQSGVADGMIVGVEIRRQRTLHLLLLLACEVLGATTLSITPQDLGDDDGALRHCDLLLLAEIPVIDRRPTVRVIPTDWLAGLADVTPDPVVLALMRRAVQAERTARLFRTSGTTGRPKVMAVSHGIQQRIVERHMERVIADISGPPIFLCLYNLSVRAVHVRVLGVLQHGGTVVFAKEAQAVPLLAAGAVNFALFTVGDAERIVARASPPPAGHHLHVELIGAHVSPALRAMIRERLGAGVSTRYSSNETNVIAITNDGDVGTLCPGVTVRIVDEAGQERPPGQTGLIRVRTDTMVDGYFDDPPLTRSAFVDGWYITGDAGYMPAPDKLVVLGRADDMLNIGGVKVPPTPLEAEIRRIPGISDAVLMSVDNRNAVGRLLAAIEVEGDRLRSGLAGHVGGILARYVDDFEIMPLPWFPRTETGKVRRNEIKAAFQRRSADAAG